MSKRGSRRLFSATAARFNKRNNFKVVMRGGYRL